MAPVVLGFDLSEMHWSAFSGREMFSRRWHLRRERFVVYQIAMLTCLAAECTATYSLAKYTRLEDNVVDASNNAGVLHSKDILAAECITIVFSVFVATLFGADFFFLLFFPRRRYPGWYVGTKKGLAIFITGGVFAAALMSNIIVASRSGFITGVSEEEAAQIVQIYNRPPLQYNKWPTNIAYVVLLWIGFISTLASAVLMIICADHDERLGPEAGHRLDRSMNPPNEMTEARA